MSPFSAGVDIVVKAEAWAKTDGGSEAQPATMKVATTILTAHRNPEAATSAAGLIRPHKEVCAVVAAGLGVAQGAGGIPVD